MARLGEMFEAIEAKLRESLAATGARLPTFGLGESDAAAFKSKPSITFIPTTGKAHPPSAPQGHVRPDGNGGYTTIYDPPALWERSLQVGARIYADDIDPCNELAERLIEAVDDLYAGRYVVEGEQWDTAGKHSGGLVLVVFFRFEARFERLAQKIVTPETMEINPAIVAEISA